MNWQLLTGFLLITLVLILVPGPIVTLVVSTGATRGMRAALVTVAGTSTGNAALLSAIALGLDWVLAHALYLFELLRWAGVAYLVYLGVRAWRSAGRPPAPLGGSQVHFWRGFLVALSNPKTLAFFTAFLPQFLDPARPVARQLAVMCVVSVVLAAASDSCWAVAAGLGRAWFVSPARARLLGRASAVTLIGGGLWLSLARRPA
ncbi:MAG TPA: LysE family translocator [Steroidobacteraceae bacterium]|nr:LysE family translocator [Steroidobacteraceae bacterium]